MTVLTDDELAQVLRNRFTTEGDARAIERAVVAKLKAECERNRDNIKPMPTFAPPPPPPSPPAIYGARTAVLADRERRGCDAVREALEETQSLLTAMLHETRHPGEISARIVANRAALSAQEGKPDCRCESCRPNTFGNMRMIVCQSCGNKRCPHATDHRNACTGSNEPGQPGSSYENVRPWNPSCAQEGKQ